MRTNGRMLTVPRVPMPPNTRPVAWVSWLGSGLDKTPRVLLQNGDELISPYITGILGSFGFGKLALSRPLSQLVDSLLKLRISAKTDHCFSFFGKHNCHQRAHSAIKRSYFGGSIHSQTLPLLMNQNKHPLTREL